MTLLSLTRLPSNRISFPSQGYKLGRMALQVFFPPGGLLNSSEFFYRRKKERKGDLMDQLPSRPLVIFSFFSPFSFSLSRLDFDFPAHHDHVVH
jgi:hypothetical protein